MLGAMVRVICLLSLLVAGCHSAPQHAPQVLKAVDHSAAAVSSWDARYHVDWEQTPTIVNGQAISAQRQEANVHEIAQGRSIYLETDQPEHAIQTSDGQRASTMLGQRDGYT